MKLAIGILIVAGAALQFLGIVEVSGRTSQLKKRLEPLNTRIWRGRSRLGRLVRSIATGKRVPPPETIVYPGTAGAYATAGDVSLSSDSVTTSSLASRVAELTGEVGTLVNRVGAVDGRLGKAEGRLDDIDAYLPDWIHEGARPSWQGMTLLLAGLTLTMTAGLWGLALQ